MATLSSQTVVAAAGTEVVLGSVQINGPLMIKALTTNGGLVYIGNVDDTISSTTGLPLAAGDVLIFNQVGSLGEIYVDAAVNGEGVAWLALEV